MSTIAVLHDAPDDWQVWIGLEDQTPPAGLSFIIGTGPTRDAAVAAAVKDLEDVIERLQQPAEAPAGDGLVLP
jgi:hypothetical protein